VATERQLEFRFDGGATWLNLLGTRGQTFGPHPIERLGTPARLAEWLARCELTPLRPPTAADVDRTHELRQALRTLALAVVDGVDPGGDALAAVRECAARDSGPVQLAEGWPPRRLPPRDATEALARIARQALEQLTGLERHQLVSCAEHDCRWVFLDPTGRRRWCPAPSCASRGRVRALRARRAAEPD
jgi:predicted RNA-binding Zn ribbon-like protein